MRTHILTLTLLILCMLSASADDKWQPVPSWPFIYSDFQSAVIKTVKGTTVNAKANIHIGHHYLWYESKGKNLEAKKGTVKEVIFPNGKHHIAVGDKICLIIKEDTIKGKLHRLLYSEEVDMPRYNDIVRNNKAAESSSTIDFMGLNNLNLDVAVRESSNISEQEPLPIKNVFFIQIGDETFEATESNILQHLDKEERKVYKAYTRKAEIITSDMNSMLDVFTTFFLR
ncbi:MAG: hypothetical protein J5932_08960 [Prevotella sp.]|nr:hypothetical protein [Prevotella sp.]